MSHCIRRCSRKWKLSVGWPSLSTYLGRLHTIPSHHHLRIFRHSFMLYYVWTFLNIFLYIKYLFRRLNNFFFFKWVVFQCKCVVEQFLFSYVPHLWVYKKYCGFYYFSYITKLLMHIIFRFWIFAFNECLYHKYKRFIKCAIKHHQFCYCRKIDDAGPSIRHNHHSESSDTNSTDDYHIDAPMDANSLPYFIPNANDPRS